MLKINELKRLDLGIKGENESKTLQIDMSAWASLYPNATAEILHKRSGDNTKTLTGATYDGDTMILTWIPTETDTFYEGFGVAEIRMVEGNVVKKTKDLIVTAVCPSVIDGSGSIIESTWQAFLNSVISTKQGAVEAKNAAETAQGLAEDAADDAEASADDAEAAAAAAEAATVHEPTIDDVSGNWLVWDQDTGAYVDTGVHAQGPQGEPGTVENVRATGIKMSILDDTTVYDAIQAKPDTSDIPTKVSELENDEGYITQHQDISGKADKVSSATSGNFAGLDENGNLTDSGHKHSDYLTQHQDISGKADKVSSATSGNFAALDANGNLTDSGHKHSDYITDVSDKADKVSSATSGNFAGLDENGNLTDSGKKAADFVAGSSFYTTEMPLSSNDSTKLSSKLSAMDSSTSDIRKGLSYVAKLTSGNWQLNSGQNAAIGDYISVNGKLGRATAAITGGSTNIVENTNWIKEDDDGALNELKDELNQKIDDGKETVGIREDGDTASQTISSGAYVVWKGVLCTADAAIPSGTTLATSGAGKNLTEVSGGAANSLKAVTDALNSKISRYFDVSVTLGTTEGNVNADIPSWSGNYTILAATFLYNDDLYYAVFTDNRQITLTTRASGIVTIMQKGGPWSGSRTVTVRVHYA